MDARMQARHALELDLRKAIADREFEVLLSAAGEAGQRGDLRLRDAHPLEPPHARHGASSRVHPARGRNGADRADRGVGPSPGMRGSRRPAGIRVAVNVSPAQFRRPGLAQVVMSALASSGLEARRLEVRSPSRSFCSAAMPRWPSPWWADHCHVGYGWSSWPPLPRASWRDPLFWVRPPAARRRHTRIKIVRGRTSALPLARIIAGCHRRNRLKRDHEQDDQAARQRAQSFHPQPSPARDSLAALRLYTGPLPLISACGTIVCGCLRTRLTPKTSSSRAPFASQARGRDQAGTQLRHEGAGSAARVRCSGKPYLCGVAHWVPAVPREHPDGRPRRRDDVETAVSTHNPGRPQEATNCGSTVGKSLARRFAVHVVPPGGHVEHRLLRGMQRAHAHLVEVGQTKTSFGCARRSSGSGRDLAAVHEDGRSPGRRESTRSRPPSSRSARRRAAASPHLRGPAHAPPPGGDSASAQRRMPGGGPSISMPTR